MRDGKREGRVLYSQPVTTVILYRGPAIFPWCWWFVVIVVVVMFCQLYRRPAPPEEILTVERPSTGFTRPSSKLTDRTNHTGTNGRTTCSVRTNQNTEITVSLSETQYRPCVWLSVKAVSAWYCNLKYSHKKYKVLPFFFPLPGSNFLWQIKMPDMSFLCPSKLKISIWNLLLY